MGRLRRILVPIVAFILAVGGIAAVAQTEPVSTAPLGTWCPPIPANAVAGQPVQCKVVADPDWVPPTTTTTVPPTTTVPTTTSPAHTDPPPTTTTTPPPSEQFPNASNTGVPAGTVLATLGGEDYRTQAAGQVIEGKRMNALIVRHANVTVRNSEITTAIEMQAGGSLTIERSTIGPARCGDDSWYSAGINGGNYKAFGVHIRGHEDGFNAGGSNIHIRDSFVDICGHPGGHSDGVQDYPRADGLLIEHNTFYGTTSPTVRTDGYLTQEPGMNSPLFINAGDKGQPVSNNVTLKNNLLLGGSWSMYLWPGDGAWEVYGNRIVDKSWWTGTAFGPFTTSGRCVLVDRWEDNDTVLVDNDFRVTSTVQNDLACK